MRFILKPIKHQLKQISEQKSPQKAAQLGMGIMVGGETWEEEIQSHTMMTSKEQQRKGKAEVEKRGLRRK